MSHLWHPPRHVRVARHERKHFFIDSVAHLATKRLELSILMTWLDIFIARHISSRPPRHSPFTEADVKYCETWRRIGQILWHYSRDILANFRSRTLTPWFFFISNITSGKLRTVKVNWISFRNWFCNFFSSLLDYLSSR